MRIRVLAVAVPTSPTAGKETERRVNPCRDVITGTCRCRRGKPLTVVRGHWLQTVMKDDTVQWPRPRQPPPWPPFIIYGTAGGTISGGRCDLMGPLVVAFDENQFMLMKWAVLCSKVTQNREIPSFCRSFQFCRFHAIFVNYVFFPFSMQAYEATFERLSNNDYLNLMENWNIIRTVLYCFVQWSYAIGGKLLQPVCRGFVKSPLHSHSHHELNAGKNLHPDDQNWLPIQWHRVFIFYIVSTKDIRVLHRFAPLTFSLIACAHVHILVWEYMQSFQRQTTVRVHAAGNRQQRGGNEPNWHFELYDSATTKFRRILLLNVAPWRRHCYFMYLHSYLTRIVFYSPLFYHV